MIREELFDGYYIYCEVIQMGRDYTVAVYGGDTPHAGSAVMSVARPSLTGEGIGVTSSVLTGIGHKDDIIARMFAETIAKSRDCTVVCVCGIHVDHMSLEQIEIVKDKCNKMLGAIIKQL